MSESAQAIRQVSDGLWSALPLWTSFRVPHAVVERQQDHFPGFRAAPGNAPGVVLVVPQGTAWTESALSGGDTAVLCRNNAPLLKLAFKLIRRGIGCRMAGRDIGQALAALSRKLAPMDDTPIARLLVKLSEWKQREVSRARADGKSDESVHDRAESLEAVASGSEAKTAGALRAAIELIFDQTTVGKLTLSSIHRAKGLEWNFVVLLDPWRIPSKRAKAEGPDALQQEFNLRYVAETRTRQTLMLANLEDFQ